MANYYSSPRFFRSGFTPPHWKIALYRGNFWTVLFNRNRRLIELPEDLAKKIEAFYQEALNNKEVQFRYRNANWGLIEREKEIPK